MQYDLRHFVCEIVAIRYNTAHYICVHTIAIVGQ